MKTTCGRWQLSDAQAASGRYVNAVPLTIAAPPDKDDVAAVRHTSLRSRQPLARRQPNSRPRQQQNSGNFADALCYFHAKFGLEAKNCKPGCPWSKNV